MEDSVTQRLNLLVETFEKGVKSSFANRIGISQQGAHDLLGSRKGGPSFKVLTKILENYPQIRMEWLLLGRGPMLQQEGTPTIEEAKAELAAEVRQRYITGYTTANAEYLRRTYHFGEEATPGLDYDDRISARLNLSKKEMKEWLDSPQFEEVPITRLGSRVVITERGVHELLGDLPKLK
jgi:hypothetical protein